MTHEVKATEFHGACCGEKMFCPGTKRFRNKGHITPGKLSLSIPPIGKP